MPIKGGVADDWRGYLLDNLAGTGQQFLEQLNMAIKAREIPFVNLKLGRVNMWWRDNTSCLDITFSLDDEVVFTVHTLDYGPSLFVGVAQSIPLQTKYSKQMATWCHQQIVDSCIKQTISYFLAASEAEQG